MLTESTKEMTLSKEEVSAAIEAIRAKGWDVNPYTVADEINVARAIIYRNVQFMRMIIEARGGTFGMDVETSLNLAHRIQDLEASKATLLEQIDKLKERLTANGNEGAPEIFQAPEYPGPPDNVQEPPAHQVEEHNPVVEHLADEHMAVVEQAPGENLGEPIYNAASIGNFSGFGPVTLSSIHWKELEKLMNLQVDTLDNLAVIAPQDQLNPEQQDLEMPEDEGQVDERVGAARAKRRPRRRTPDITGDFEAPPEHLRIAKSRAEIAAEQAMQHAEQAEQVAAEELTFAAAFHQSTPVEIAPHPEPDPIDQIDLDEIAPRLQHHVEAAPQAEDEQITQENEIEKALSPRVQRESLAPPELVAPVEPAEDFSDTSWIEEEELALHEEAIALSAERHEQIVGVTEDYVPVQEPAHEEAPLQEQFAQQAPSISDGALAGPHYAFDHLAQAPQETADESFVELEAASDHSIILDVPHVPSDHRRPKDRAVITDDYPQIDPNAAILDLESADIFQDMDSEMLESIEVIEDVVMPEEALRPVDPTPSAAVVNLIADPEALEVLEEALGALTPGAHDALTRLHSDASTTVDLNEEESLLDGAIYDPTPDPVRVHPVEQSEELAHEVPGDTIAEVPEEAIGQTAEGLVDEADTVSGEELRKLIKSRIEQAAEQQILEQQQAALAAKEKEKEREKEKEAPKGPARNKFVGTKAAEPAAVTSNFATRVIPPEIRKACLMLGVRPDEITAATVTASWKQIMSSPGVHPDLGGDTESAIYLNTAKDTLIRWLDQQAPKLGKKFGQPAKESPKADPPENKKHSK
jgi:hypothetical protein